MSVTVMVGGGLGEIGPAPESALQLTKRMKTTPLGLCALSDPASAMVDISGMISKLVFSNAAPALALCQ